jgi:hypothetical protein
MVIESGLYSFQVSFGMVERGGANVDVAKNDDPTLLLNESLHVFVKKVMKVYLVWMVSIR